MTDEVQAAAERVRVWRSDDSKADNPYSEWIDEHGCRQSHSLPEDEWTIIRAYIAEHPEDDGEPVTAEWLESMGWVYLDDCEMHEFRAGAVKLSWRPDAVYAEDSEDWICLRDNPTRRQVRLLMEALGQ